MKRVLTYSILILLLITTFKVQSDAMEQGILVSSSDNQLYMIIKIITDENLHTYHLYKLQLEIDSGTYWGSYIEELELVFILPGGKNVIITPSDKSSFSPTELSILKLVTTDDCNFRDDIY